MNTPHFSIHFSILPKALLLPLLLLSCPNPDWRTAHTRCPCVDGWVCQDGRCVASGDTLKRADFGTTNDTCQPKSCASLGYECGQADDGCGGLLDCGSCGKHQICQDHRCVASSLCGDGRCDPQAGENCQNCPQDCGCQNGQQCINGQCISCKQYCQQNGKRCGTLGNCDCGPVVCSPGEKRCNGNSIEVCSGDGCEWEFSMNCQYGCTNGRCNSPQCEHHADYGCRGDNIYWKDSCGNWEEVKESCQCGCSGKTCISPVCQFGQRKCNGNDRYECDGCNWVFKETCSYGCSDGDCVPPPPPECGNGICELGNDENCKTCPQDCGCPQSQVCYQDYCCTPDCSNKECGDNGCGGICGVCPAGYVCKDWHCYQD